MAVGAAREKEEDWREKGNSKIVRRARTGLKYKNPPDTADVIRAVVLMSA